MIPVPAGDPGAAVSNTSPGRANLPSIDSIQISGYPYI